MLAYKFLAADRRGPVTGFAWPASGWVEAVGPLRRCRCGVHACRIDDLAHWLGPDLWRIELAGEVIEAPDALVARRGRLVSRVATWAAGGAHAFAEDCARRAAELAGEASAVADRAGDAAVNAAEGAVGPTAYIAAAVAGEAAAARRDGDRYRRAFDAERVRQARWIADSLALTAG